MDQIQSPEGRELLDSIFAAIREGRPDEAQRAWEELQAHAPLPESTKALPAYIMLSRGQTMDALRYVNDLPEDAVPEVRALCLRMAGDPTWHAHARALEDSPDPLIREGARQMLEAGDHRVS